LAIVAVINGVVRETVFVSALGEQTAHVLSTAILVAAVVAGASLFVSRYARTAARATLLGIGAGWVALTVGFEFVFGHYVDGKSWAVLLADYDLLAGRVWIAVPLALLLAPAVVAWLLDRREGVEEFREPILR
jgi:hypothetical protein